jgi:type IV secretion system protein VirB9
MKFGRLAAVAFIPALVSLMAPFALAQEDPRFVSHEYKANEVVKLHGRLGVQATITFDEGEQIENVAVGDSQKWQVAPNKRANLLFVKPLDAAAVTNMTVVTNKRTYLFDLVASVREQPVYMFQFTYGNGGRIALFPPRRSLCRLRQSLLPILPLFLFQFPNPGQWLLQPCALRWTKRSAASPRASQAPPVRRFPQSPRQHRAAVRRSSISVGAAVAMLRFTLSAFMVTARQPF